jgi:AraC-like DNA-binding protein
VEITRRTLFGGDALKIGLFAARPSSDACGEVERQSAHAVVLPVAGLFSRHDAPGRNVIGTPSHAVLVAADTPYRVSFPGAIGDRALILRFDDAVAPDWLDCGGRGDMASHGLLPAGALMLRNLLWAKLQRGAADAFEAEALGLDLLDASLDAMRTPRVPARTAHIRHMRAVERVKEAVALAPGASWTVTKLARVANSSPFHLCHVFRETVGTSLYDYVLQERLAHALEAVVDGGDLSAIAFDAGFASHSHFTARFRRFFGCTPSALRHNATAKRMTEFRKIMTARRRRVA